MQRSVTGHNALVHDLGYWGLFEIYDVEVGFVELLEVSPITEWSASVEVMRLQLSAFLGVVDDFGDFGADELACCFIGFFIICYVAESTEPVSAVKPFISSCLRGSSGHNVTADKSFRTDIPRTANQSANVTEETERR